MIRFLSAGRQRLALALYLAELIEKQGTATILEAALAFAEDHHFPGHGPQRGAGALAIEMLHLGVAGKREVTFPDGKAMSVRVYEVADHEDFEKQVRRLVKRLDLQRDQEVETFYGEAVVDRFLARLAMLEGVAS